MSAYEEEDFELVLGNRQLFFLAVVLFGLFFSIGYTVGYGRGRNSEDGVAAASQETGATAVVPPAAAPPVRAAEIKEGSDTPLDPVRASDGRTPDSYRALRGDEYRARSDEPRSSGQFCFDARTPPRLLRQRCRVLIGKHNRNSRRRRSPRRSRPRCHQPSAGCRRPPRTALRSPASPPCVR